jgi:hypothetical protein
MMLTRRLLLWLLLTVTPLAAILFQCVPFPAVAAEQESDAKFGTTVVIPSGLRGFVYHVRHNTARLPDFGGLKPVGDIYTASLNIPPQDFRLGFPGVTKRFEWFAIDYKGRFWIDNPGAYRFVLTSDDGARLYIDDELIVDNDGQHPPQDRTGSITMSVGIHRVRVSYFQGPRFQVALVLQVAPPGEQFRVFSTDEFKPPLHPKSWPYSGPAGDRN